MLDSNDLLYKFAKTYNSVVLVIVQVFIVNYFEN